MGIDLNKVDEAIIELAKAKNADKFGRLLAEQRVLGIDFSGSRKLMQVGRKFQLEVSTELAQMVSDALSKVLTDYIAQRTEAAVKVLKENGVEIPAAVVSTPGT